MANSIMWHLKTLDENAVQQSELQQMFVEYGLRVLMQWLSVTIYGVKNSVKKVGKNEWTIIVV